MVLLWNRCQGYWGGLGWVEVEETRTSFTPLLNQPQKYRMWG